MAAAREVAGSGTSRAIRVAVVAGPEPGHVFPAVALCLRFRAAGDEPVLFTGSRWLARLRAEGIRCGGLPLLAATDDDTDAGARLHRRAAAMAAALVPALRAFGPDVVVSDVLTAAGGLAAELTGTAWVELSPHPLYLPSRGLPPIGSGLAVGSGIRGRARDALLRRLTARSIRAGVEQRRIARLGIGLPGADPGPSTRLVATIPALEVPRPDWPDNAQVVGPLSWDPETAELTPPRGAAPLVLVSPSTAAIGTTGLLDAAVQGLTGVRMVGTVLPARGESHRDLVRVEVPSWAVIGSGRQDPLLEQAAVVVSGAGHGMLVKALVAGKPLVLIPGGGDQRELAARAQRQGSALILDSPAPDGLNIAVHQVLDDPAYAEAARRAAASMATVVADPVSVCHELL